MRHPRQRDDVPPETPSSVIGSIAFGVAPLPFLAVYSVLFIVHGMFYPVQPPDITSSQSGEALAGWIAFALFLVGIITVFWFLGAKRRWPFLLGQLATFITAVDFVFDSTKGSPAVSLLLVLTSGLALVLGVLPASWDYMGVYPPSLPRRLRRGRRGGRRSAVGRATTTATTATTATATTTAAPEPTDSLVG